MLDTTLRMFIIQGSLRSFTIACSRPSLVP